MALKFENVKMDHTSSARGGFAVTPSDATDFAAPARALWVGVQGTVVVVFLDDTTATLVNATGLIPVICKRVNSTSTTATSIVALT